MLGSLPATAFTLSELGTPDLIQQGTGGAARNGVGQTFGRWPDTMAPSSAAWLSEVLRLAEESLGAGMSRLPLQALVRIGGWGSVSFGHLSTFRSQGAAPANGMVTSGVGAVIER